MAAVLGVTLAAGALSLLAPGVSPASSAPAPKPTAKSAHAADAATPVINKWHGLNPVTELTADTFATPPDTDRPWVRWNWVPATTTIAELETMLDELHAAGIRGVEIGQGGNPTNEQLTAVLTKANALGITVGLKYSGGAPTAANWSNTENYTRKTLNQTAVKVAAGATYNAAVPGTGTIVGVLAYRCSTSPCATTGAAQIERSSAVNLTTTLTGTNTAGFFGATTAGNLSWTAPASPAGAEWVVITFRAVALGVTPEVLSTQGTDALIAGYEAMWTPEIKALLKENHSDLFVDSHISDPWGTATDLWSSNITADFLSQTGYALAPNLAALFYANYAYSDKSDQRVRTDFYQVRNDLFIKNRITRLQDWAHTRGLSLRLQNEDPAVGGAEAPYQDTIDTALVTDRPEHESLAGADQIDVYRPIASANHWNDNPWFSTECCAATPENYVQTMQDIEARMNKEFAAGITKLVYHIYPATSTPTSTFPGYSNFGPNGFSGSWGPRNPNWTNDAPAVNDWMARNQQVLTQGKADTDVAVYLHTFEYPNLTNVNTDGSYFGNRQWDDLSLQRAGYSWDYLNPTMVKSAKAKVTDGVLAANGPSYGAMVVDAKINTPLHPLKTAMPVTVASRLLEFAQDGLPILFVGDLPSSTPGDTPGSDADLQGIISDLIAQPTVYRVGSEAGVPAKLASLGLAPDIDPAERSGLVGLHRTDAASDTDYYFLYNEGFNQTDTTQSRSTVYEEPGACRVIASVVNPCRMTGEATDQLITLKGTGTPYTLDAATGEVTPFSTYTVGDGTVTVRVQLGLDQSTIVALSDDATRFGDAVAARHVVSTTADDAALVDGRVVMQDRTPGTYTVTLSDGTVVSATVAAAAPALDLTGATWQLDAEDWKNAFPIGTTGVDGSAITKDPVSVTLNGLAAWPDIPELTNASGVGTYTTTVDLGSDWVPGSKAVLSLGQVVDTVALSVNGTSVPIDQLKATADIGAYLTTGANTLKVRVSTTLNNRLYVLFPAVATRGITQEYGLVGPVTLTPYGATAVGAPVNTVAPSITGTAAVGQTLTCVDGTWTDATSYAYTWAADGTPIAGATSSSLTLGAGTVGATVTCTVTATGPLGEASATSDGVVVAKGAALVASVKPRITGTAVVGKKLTATPGTWTPAAASYTYVWKRNGKAIAGATARTYVVKAADVAKKITVTVTAIKPGYASGKATSPAVKPTKKK